MVDVKVYFTVNVMVDVKVYFTVNVMVKFMVNIMYTIW